jgi:hypothetical protein
LRGKRKVDLVGSGASNAKYLEQLVLKRSQAITGLAISCRW